MSHSEFASIEARANILRGFTARGHLEIMDDAGSIERHRGQNASLHQVDDQRREADLDRMGAHPQRDTATLASCQHDRVSGPAQIFPCENIGQPFEKRREAEPGFQRQGQTIDLHFAGPFLQGIGAGLASIEARRFGNGVGFFLFGRLHGRALNYLF